MLTEADLDEAGLPKYLDGKGTPKDKRQINHRRAVWLNNDKMIEAWDIEASRRRSKKKKNDTAASAAGGGEDLDEAEEINDIDDEPRAGGSAAEMLEVNSDHEGSVVGSEGHGSAEKRSGEREYTAEQREIKRLQSRINKEKKKEPVDQVRITEWETRIRGIRLGQIKVFDEPDPKRTKKNILLLHFFSFFKNAIFLSNNSRQNVSMKLFLSLESDKGLKTTSSS